MKKFTFPRNQTLATISRAIHLLDKHGQRALPAVASALDAAYRRLLGGRDDVDIIIQFDLDGHTLADVVFQGDDGFWAGTCHDVPDLSNFHHDDMVMVTIPMGGLSNHLSTLMLHFAPTH